MADWIADGWGFLKKKDVKEEEEEEDRMSIRLNLLVNCHLLRNASFDYFCFNFFLI